ncbi:glycosyl hydrolase family 18 protein [Gracilinema caldarium]|nr:glycosyl hydrolase family 18 protein [Gracilinema caldarium]
MKQYKCINSILMGLLAVMVLLSCASSQTLPAANPPPTNTLAPDPTHDPTPPLQASQVSSAPIVQPAPASPQEEFQTVQTEPIPVKLIREEPPISGKPEPVTFREIWGYVQAGEESALDLAWPVSDVALFSASISSTGKLKGIPKRSKLSGYTGKVHLVVAELGNYALTHFCLNPAYPVRSSLITQIAEAAQNFDGVQIDFEAVLTDDKDNFISFLRSIKSQIGKKTLSIALPARTKKVAEAYNYEQIAQVADRIIIMAYDEHWSGSTPGSVASLTWCEKVADYALKTIGNKKLVMGIPFYGRAWGEINPSRAYRFSSLSKLMEEKGIQETSRVDGSVYFEYSELIKVKVFYEDHRSVHQRAELYYTQGINNIAFWRIGQEDRTIWNFLHVQSK